MPAKRPRPKQQRIDPRTVRAGATSKGRTRRAPSRSGSPAAVRPAGVRDWIGGARIRTLPLSIAPVALGTACAYLVSEPGYHWVRALLCLALALLLQIGVNFANDYSDGVRGTDRYRVGPSRLTGSGAARPRTVLVVALCFFALAAIVGVVLVVLSREWWLLAVGAACIVAAWLYTGGKRPYGYYGLGELFVFVFFGLVATLGTTFVQVRTITLESWLCAIAAGSLACAVLLVNNLRDREQDRLAGKRTLAVLIGDVPSRVLYVVLLLAVPFGVLTFFSLLFPFAGYVFFVLIAAVPAAVITLFARTARELIWALQLTTLTSLLFGLGLGAALVFL